MKIQLWGAPHAGKTTLADAVAEAHGIPKISEFATEWLHANGGYDAWLEAGPGVQALFAQLQRRRELDGNHWISDSPSGLSWLYAASRPDAASPNGGTAALACYNTFLECIHQPGVMHCYLPILYPYERDGIRITEEQARTVDRQLLAVLRLHNVGVRDLSGYTTLEQRVEVLGETIRGASYDDR